MNLPPSPADSFHNGYEAESNGNVKPSFKSGKVPTAAAVNESVNQNVSPNTSQILKSFKEGKNLNIGLAYPLVLKKDTSIAFNVIFFHLSL